ncbi:hypothetical protein EFR01_18610 [Sinorhizobium fredii]|nr:hypothetical protein EFR01_18610 [Sinorhizobium fredii]
MLIDFIGKYEPMDRDLQIITAAPFGYEADEIEIALVAGTNQRFMSRYTAAMSYLINNGLVWRVRKTPITLTDQGREYFEGRAEFDVDNLDIDPPPKGFSPADVPLIEASEPQAPPSPPAPALSKDEMLRQKAKRAADKTIQSLPDMPLSRLYTVWVNAHRIASEESDPHMKAASIRVLDEIGAERKRRGAVASTVSPDESFRWPTTASTASAGGSREQRSTEGVLASIGYHVGRTRGGSTLSRRRMLAGIFDGSLIDGPTEEQLPSSTWGFNGSGRRLRLMANTIANLAKSAKGRDPAALAVAISQWEEDLEWMRLTFYEGRFDFTWPLTSIASLDRLEDS